ncbi:hypothetical protein [Curvivirga sp.]|uniref:hypothetical protein n=1 Tax=Curvivirga sp. TaxID=2856848 RepID=UPI003B596AF6
MIRIILTVVLPLIAPTLIYFFLVRLRAKWKKEDETAEHIPAYHAWPWFRLIGFGGVLLILTFLVFGFPNYDGFHGKYVPPHMENGELVPGQFVKETDE